MATDLQLEITRIEPPEDLPALPDAAIRPEAIHLHGTDEMSTDDVLAYFDLYSPTNVEWINDSSCNVVWVNSSSAREALLDMSTPLTTQCEDTATTEHSSPTPTAANGGGSPKEGERQPVAEGQHSEVVDSSSRQEQEVGVVTAGEQEVGVDKETGQEVGVAIRVEDRTEEGEMGDTGGGRTDDEDSDCEDTRRNIFKTSQREPEESASTLCWRRGQPHHKANRLLLRLATAADVKERGAARKSKYYQKYGKPGGKERGVPERGGSLGYLKNRTWRVGRREGEEEEEEKEGVMEDLRLRLGKKHSLPRDTEDEDMETETQEEDNPFASLAKRPKPLHSDRPDDALDVTELMDESEKRRRLTEVGVAGGLSGLGGGRGDLRRALQQRKKRRNLMLRLGHTPRLVERKN